VTCVCAAAVATSSVSQQEKHLDKLKLQMRQVLIYRGEDGFWVAECPSLPGCIAQGANKQEAVANIKEAIEGYVVPLQEDGLPVPEDRFDAEVVAV
jgi:predicted RNase H-like HicB family nuclease